MTFEDEEESQKGLDEVERMFYIMEHMKKLVQKKQVPLAMFNKIIVQGKIL